MPTSATTLWLHIPSVMVTASVILLAPPLSRRLQNFTKHSVRPFLSSLFTRFISSSSSSSSSCSTAAATAEAGADNMKNSTMPFESEFGMNGESFLQFVMAAGKIKRVRRAGWLRYRSEVESVSDHMYRMALMCVVMLAAQTNNYDNHSPSSSSSSSSTLSNTHHHAAATTSTTSITASDDDDDSDDNEKCDCSKNKSGRINMLRCMILSLLHDLSEAEVGDILPESYSGISKSEKHERELTAMLRLTSMLPKHVGEFLMKGWEEYEQGQTRESKLVKELDKIEMIVQACEYEQADANGDFPFLSCDSTSSSLSSSSSSFSQQRPCRQRTLEEFFVSVEGKIHCPLLQQLQRAIQHERPNLH